MNVNLYPLFHSKQSKLKDSKLKSKTFVFCHEFYFHFKRFYFNWLGDKNDPCICQTIFLSLPIFKLLINGLTITVILVCLGGYSLNQWNIISKRHLSVSWYIFTQIFIFLHIQKKLGTSFGRIKHTTTNLFSWKILCK